MNRGYFYSEPIVLEHWTNHKKWIYTKIFLTDIIEKIIKPKEF